ncbi:Hpt domain-containing protein [Reinekea sp. G2M2-21]|uniref:Hpt domain-containing protein n=1 Tax=Reinekea sp. G2M2-21 TaxID=2788942 RepID=UPI0018A89046|nr:Hpt domain-containing protein [Reinekea sp. G2M2-21]
MADRRDYVALEWVKGEIDETLKQARYALEAFVETPDDTTRLEFSLSYIHQVYGTLQMVEFFGAALLAEEMEQLNQAIVNGSVPANSDNLAVLMQAIIQLPTYLDQLKQGQHDLPVIVLPLLNDLRAARGESLLSETALFAPELSAARRFIGEPDYSAFSKPQTAQLIRKLRQMYQLALLGWLKGDDVSGSLDFLAKSVARMVKLTERTKIGALWRVVDAFVTAIKADLITRSPATVKVMRDIDHAFKDILSSPLNSVQEYPSETFLKNLLFYLAKLGTTGIDRVDKVQRQFRLIEALPSDHEVETQRARLAGPDKEAVGSVVTALLEELSRLKDALDLMVRTQVTETSRLSELAAPIQQLCDTMAVVGLGNPRRVLSEQLDIIRDAQAKPTLEDDGVLMDIAGAVLYVEATLSGIVADSNLDSPNHGNQVDVNNAHNAVLREARNGIEQVKDAIVEYIGSHFDHALLAEAPATLGAIRGGLLMVPLNDAARILQAVQEYVQNRLITERYRPEWQEMDLLADALVGVEYYLERLTRDGHATSLDILERAAGSLEKLGVTIILTGNRQSEASPVLEPESESHDAKADSASSLGDGDSAVNVNESLDSDQFSVESEIEITPTLAEAEEQSSVVEVTETDSDDSLTETVIDWGDEVASETDTVIDFGDDSITLDIEDDWQELPIAEINEDEFNDTLVINQAEFSSEEQDLTLDSGADVKAESIPVEQPESDAIDELVVDSEIESETSDSVVMETDVSDSAGTEESDDLIDDEILEIFIEEAEEVIETIREFYPKYKADESDSGSLTEFRRAFHTLKGSGRMVGATVVGETAWAIENMLNRLIDGSIQRSEDLLRVIEEVTAEVPALVKAFEDKVKPDTTRADFLSEIAHALSKGEAVQWESTTPAIDDADAVDESVENQEDLDNISAVEATELDVGIAEDTFSAADNFQVTDDFEQFDEDSAEVGDADGDENLLKIFKTELESHLEFVENYLTDEPVGNKLPDALQRALHTIKGSAHMASMEVIADTVLPVEFWVKDLQERGQQASQEFVALTGEMVSLIKRYVDSEPSAAQPQDVANFISRVTEQRRQLSSADMATQQEEVSLMSIFLSESMDIVMDAESILEQWRDRGDSGHATETLIRELDTLAQAAHAVDLMPLSQLSNELKSLYQAAESNPYIIEEKFFDLAYDGHESLISMMDRLAAGQSIRTDALFSERLQQLYTVYAIPFEVVAPKAVDSELSQLESLNHESGATKGDSSLVEDPAPVATEAAERYMIDGDPELVEIFLEEANDILESIQHSLENWVADTKNTIEVESLQRDLHTLKGGARMAEVTPLGDLAHELEFLYEGLAQGQYHPSEGLIALLQQCHDRLAVMVGDIESSMTCMSAPDLVAAISHFRKNPGAPATPATLTAVVEEPAEEADFDEVVPASESSDEISSAEPHDADDADISKPESEVTAIDSDQQDVSVDLPDDLDFDILEIFIDEAGELLNELENAVEEWRADSSNEAHADEMKRVLHTLKGGARLARLKELGDQSHDFETFVIRAQQNKLPLDERFFADILARQDRLVSNIEELQKILEQHGTEGGGFGPSVIQMVSDLDESEIEQISSERQSETPKLEVVPKPEVTAQDEQPANKVVPFKAKTSQVDSRNDGGGAQARRAQPQETVKVSANLLEGLVNLAGETSISRARLEQEVSDFGFTLGDMDQTIDRLRDHVRRLDMETEAQIIFRQERAEETNYEDFDPLEMDRYSQIQQLSRSLMEATYDLQDIKSTLSDKTRDAETILLQQSRINTELQEGLMRTRMVPFNRLLPRLRRIVRQVSGELGKQVDFIVGNAEGEVDRTVLERMISPLEHLLRNAVDHGIEMPEGRQAAGKNAKGIIELELSREGGDIVLRLQDDGKGIDVDKIKDKAIERGLMKPDADLNETEIMQFILEAGFSTAEKVTQISGRGVGMDVVNSEVKQLGGNIYIDSQLGQGTVFTIRLPFTVSVNRALMVNTLDDLYALPLTSIEGIVRVTPKQLAEYYQPNAPLFEYGGRRYRLEYMGALLHTGARPAMSSIETSVPLVLVRGSDDRHSMALHVDRLMGSREIVVKTLGAQFSKVPGVSGATILGDGSVVVILDLSALIRSELVVEHQNAAMLGHSQPENEPRKKDGPSKVMVCDDSVTVRKVTSRLLERNGMDVMLAKHGADAIAQMIDEIPDLILLDIEMPHMDGFEVASRVRHDERLKHIPIIMITSRTGSKHRERALSIGVNEYMGKPFQEGPLLAMIERLLNES